MRSTPAINLISRRRFLHGATLGLAAFTTFRSDAFAAPLSLKLAVGTPTLAVDTATYASIPFTQKYYAGEGLDVQMVPLAGAGLVGQLLIGGGAFMGTPGTSAGLYVPVSQGADLVSVYNIVTRSFQLPMVPVDSPIKSMADFKGKRIGVQSLATGTIPIIKGMLRDGGLDPERDVELVPVGLGASAAAALFVRKIVDGLGLWDGPYASIINLDPTSYQLRPISSPTAEHIGFQTALVVRRETLKSQRQAVIGIARSVAKATVYAKANAEAAVSEHYATYPEQQPTDVSAADALRQGERILTARLENTTIRDNWSVKKWGWHDAGEVEAYYTLLRNSGDLAYDIPDLKKLYTNELIDEINAFDAAAVEKQAREHAAKK